MFEKKLTPFIGSEVEGIDLSNPAQLQEQAGALRAMLAERQVLFFRNQELSPEQQVDVARVFGPVEPISSTFSVHPEEPHMEVLVSSGRRTGTDIWHSDLSWLEIPAAGACLYAIDVPACGGDTMWSSMTKAYEELDPDMQRKLGELTALHDWDSAPIREHLLNRDPTGGQYRAMREKHPPVEHPVIYTHPVTGKPVLFVNSQYTSSIRGVSHDESVMLISWLTQFAKTPEWQIRFKWEPKTVAVWDNVATQHYAINDYHPYPRKMHRVAFRRDTRTN